MRERKNYPSFQADQFNVRFPDGMRDRIAATAKGNGRSMNAEIIARLERSFAAHEMGFKADGLDIAGYLAMALMIALDDDSDAETKRQVLSRAREIARPLMEGLVFSKTSPSTVESAKPE